MKESLFDGLRKELEKTGWITAGYDEQGRLIQYNVKTKKTRVLNKWVEVWKNEEEEGDLEGDEGLSRDPRSS